MQLSHLGPVLPLLLWFLVSLASSSVLAGAVVMHEGKPFFPIGIYHYPERLPLQPQLEELANAGFNTVLSPLTTSHEFLDAARDHGIGVMATLGGYMILSSDEDPKMDVLKQHIERLKDHPSLLGYEAPDEIAWGDFNSHPGQNLEGVLRGYEYIKFLDPDHPIWMNHAPRNTIEYLRSYSEGGDILGTDIYPVPEGGGHSDLDPSLNCVAQYTEKLDQVGQGKPIYMVLQGFDWDDLPPRGEKRGRPGRQPTWPETRFMAYDAICHGSNGIIYWGMAYARRDDPIWTHLKRIASELRDLTPILLDGSFQRISSEDPDIEMHLKEHDGWNYLFVLNTKREELEGREIQLPSGWRSGMARVLFEDRSLSLNEGRMADSFGPYDVHIYTDDPRPDVTVTVENPEFLETGKKADIRFKVQNRGRTTAPAFNLSLASLYGEVARVRVAQLAPSSSRIVGISWTPDSPGNFSLRVTADPEGKIGEVTHGNNEQIFTLLIGESKADLRIEDIFMENQSSLSAIITNGGIALAGSFTASLMLGGEELVDYGINGLLPGENATASWLLPANITGAIHCEIMADSLNQVDEMLEGNNKAPTIVYVEDLVESGPAFYPRDLSQDGLWIIKYDPAKGRGTIPADSDACTLVWTINDLKFPFDSPRDSRNVNDWYESVMEKGLDGLWYVIIPNQEARTLSFKFRDRTEWGTNWDDNNGKGWRTVHFADLIESGPAVYPRDLSENGLWIIKYDPAKGRGTIPVDSDTCTLVWTIDYGKFPPLSPPDSHNINGSCESVMEEGLDGLWYVTIPYQQVRTLSFRFRDAMEWGTNWDDNDGKGWRTVSSKYVHGFLAEFDRLVGNGTKYGADMSAYTGKLAKAWSDYLGGNFSEALYEIDNNIKAAGMEYGRQLLKVTTGQLEELRTLGIDVSQDEELLQRAGAMIEKGIYQATELYCNTVLQHIAEEKANIPEAFAVLTLTSLALIASRKGSASCLLDIHNSDVS